MHLENATGARTTKHAALANEVLHVFSMEVHKTSEEKRKKEQKKKNKTNRVLLAVIICCKDHIQCVSVRVCVVFTFFIFCTECVCSLRYKVHAVLGGPAEESAETFLFWL